MWLRRTRGSFAASAVALLLALAAAGCEFQPMYAQTPLFGTGPSLRDALRDVEVAQITGRIGHELRNDLIFELTGGDGPNPGAPYRLTLVAYVGSLNPIIDAASGRPEAETVTFDVDYKLHDVAQNRTVLAERAVARVSIDRTQQRFARLRALRDAENRAAKVVAEQIRSRLASFFLTKT